MWYDTEYEYDMLDVSPAAAWRTHGESPHYKTPPDKFEGVLQTWDEFLVSCHEPENITHMVIWGEIPPDLGTITPELQRLELRETPQHSIDK